MLLHPEVPSAVYLQGSLPTPDFFTSLRDWQGLNTLKKGSLWIYIRGVSLGHGGLLPRYPVAKESVLRGPQRSQLFPQSSVAGISANVLMTLVGCIIFAKFIASSIGGMKLISEPASISGRVPFL